MFQGKLKDVSFELVPTHMGGLANLVSLFGVDGLRETREEYASLPHLRAHVPQERGVIGRPPRKISARLLTIRLGQEMDIDTAMQRINTSISERVQGLAERHAPTLTFSAKLHTSQECKRQVWKIRSRANPLIAELRQKIRNAATDAGFIVEGNIEQDVDSSGSCSIVHLVLRGRWKNDGPSVRPPPGRDEVGVMFDKMTFQCRWLDGPPEGFIANLPTINFGLPAQVRNEEEFRPPPAIGDFHEFPPPQTSPLPRRRRALRGVSRSSGETSHVQLLHNSTQMPLENDVEVAIGLSVEVSDNAAQGDNARAADGILRSMISQGSHLLLVSSLSGTTSSHSACVSAPARLDMPRCFLPWTLFLRMNGQLVTASELRDASRDSVQGPSGHEVVVERCIRHRAEERSFVRLRLERGGSPLTITADHQLVVEGPQGAQRHMEAQGLASDANRARVFDGFDFQVVDKATPFRKSQEVFEITFAGDSAVLIWMVPKRRSGCSRSLSPCGMVAVLGAPPRPEDQEERLRLSGVGVRGTFLSDLPGPDVRRSLSEGSRPRGSPMHTRRYNPCTSAALLHALAPPPPTHA